ncbi:hypothetical protein QZH41_019602, partial [Actinostola sp. cb2023]
MGRLSYGPGNAHVLQSKGADVGVMKLYCTEYSSHYGQEGFNPRTGKHVGTGYQSNFRPGVYYNRKLDELDNPAMGRIVSDNYASITNKHFLPSKGSSGIDPFSRGLYMTATSGFVKDIPGTLPKSHQVANVHVDTRAYGTVHPFHRPLLHNLKQKDPIARENALHGPLYMSTEAKARFLGLPSNRMNTSCKTVGYKEGSGFTHAYNDEPVTFNPMESYDGLIDPRFTYRPTGFSVMKGSFRPVQDQHGNEQFPVMSHGSDRSTGFTHGTKVKPVFYRKLSEAYTQQDDLHPQVQQRIEKKDPCEYSNISKPFTYSSTTKLAFRGKQTSDPSEAQKLGSVFVGSKDIVKITTSFFETAETEQSLRRFNTHYNA